MVFRLPDGGNGGWRSVFSELDQLRDDFDSLLGEPASRLGTFPEATALYPPVNLWSDANKLVLTAELPGLGAKDLDVSITGRSLTLKGKMPEVETQAEIYRCERPTGSFLRTFELPYEVDDAKVEAQLNHGLLAVAMPRCAADKPKQIHVKVGSTKGV
jgi:HSP20 family protein